MFVVGFGGACVYVCVCVVSGLLGVRREGLRDFRAQHTGP